MGLMQSLVYSVKRNGDRTQPRGAQVLVMMMEDFVEPTLMD